MIELCAEAGESLVWLDPYGRKLSYRKMVMRCFDGIEQWEAMLSVEPVCVHSLSTKTKAVRLDQAAAMARRRIARTQARERRIRRERPEQQTEHLDL